MSTRPAVVATLYVPAMESSAIFFEGPTLQYGKSQILKTNFSDSIEVALNYNDQ